MSYFSILETKVGNDKFMEPGKLQNLRTKILICPKKGLKSLKLKRLEAKMK